MADDVNDSKVGLENYKNNCYRKTENYWELSKEVFERINDDYRQCYVVFMISNPFIAKRKQIDLQQNIFIKNLLLVFIFFLNVLIIKFIGIAIIRAIY